MHATPCYLQWVSATRTLQHARPALASEPRLHLQKLCFSLFKVVFKPIPLQKPLGTIGDCFGWSRAPQSSIWPISGGSNALVTAVQGARKNCQILKKMKRNLTYTHLFCDTVLILGHGDLKFRNRILPTQTQCGSIQFQNLKIVSRPKFEGCF